MWAGRGELRAVNGGAGPLAAKPASAGTSDTETKDLGSWQGNAPAVCGAGAWTAGPQEDPVWSSVGSW